MASPSPRAHSGPNSFEPSPPASPAETMASSFSRVLEGAVSAAVHAGVEAATAPMPKSDYGIDSPRLRFVDSVLRLETPLDVQHYYELNQL